MSGLAGASAESERHALFLNSGRMNHALPPPGVKPGAPHFEAENRQYVRWLERARPALDEVLREAVEAQAMPVLAWQPKRRQDVLQVIDGSTTRARFRLSVLVSRTLSDAQQEWLRRRVATALEKHAADR